MRVSCDPADLRVWHFVLRGAPDTAYSGGYYWGRLEFPDTYPITPPVGRSPRAPARVPAIFAVACIGRVHRPLL